MKFVIIGTDGPDGARLRPLHREAHLERLSRWQQQGKLILAGPFTDQPGSLMIIEAADMGEARAFAQEDPYMLNGIFQDISIRPFRQVFPEDPNHATSTS